MHVFLSHTCTYTLLYTVLHGYAETIKQHKQTMPGGMLSNFNSNQNIDMHIIYIKIVIDFSGNIGFIKLNLVFFSF